MDDLGPDGAERTNRAVDCYQEKAHGPTLCLRLKTAWKPYVLWSLGPKSLKREFSESWGMFCCWRCGLILTYMRAYLYMYIQICLFMYDISTYVYTYIYIDTYTYMFCICSFNKYMHMYISPKFGRSTIETQSAFEDTVPKHLKPGWPTLTRGPFSVAGPQRSADPTSMYFRYMIL